MMTGIRQLRRTKALETELVGGLKVPTLAEMARIKAWLLATRHTVRDYLDTVVLLERLGNAGAVEALGSLDELYPQESGASPLVEVVERLASAEPTLAANLSKLVEVVRERLPGIPVYLDSPMGIEATAAYTRFLAEHDVKMLVVACNSASSVALEALAAEVPVQRHGQFVDGGRQMGDRPPVDYRLDGMHLVAVQFDLFVDFLDVLVVDRVVAFEITDHTSGFPDQ